ncbi:ANTAR domain-containing protein [Streptomyces sp. NPDC059002]|uniref:ANTAR domain-containing protein n=1 Tax=Streptomyces sp. NPDC059002 TaxID=3346690 RepID=UPI00367FF1D6
MDQTGSDHENDDVARALAEAAQDIAYTPQELAARLAELKARPARSAPHATGAPRPAREARSASAEESGRSRTHGSSPLATTAVDTPPPAEQPSRTGMGERPRGPLYGSARRNVERILRAARAVFGTLGYDAPMEDIARRARIGVSTIYRYFPRREALVRQIAEEEAALLNEQARNVLDEESEPGEALAKFVRTAVMSGSGRLLHPDAVAGLPTEEPALADLLHGMEQLLSRARASDDVRADITVRDLLMVISSAPPHHPDPAVRAELTTRMLDVLLAGLRAEHQRKESFAEQLATASQRRIDIEHAKGILAERLHIDPEQAFALMRHHARHSRKNVSDVALEIIREPADSRRFLRPDRD